MKIVKEYSKCYRIWVAFSLLAVFFLVEIKAMIMSPKAMQYSKALTKRRKERLRLDEQEKKLGTNEFSVYKPGGRTNSSVVVSFQVAEKSGFLTLLRDSISTDNKRIPINDYSINQVRDVCDIIQNWLSDQKKDWLSDQEKEQNAVKGLLLGDLINKVNLLDIFTVSEDITKIYLKKIKKDIVNGLGTINDVKKLNSALQQSLMLDSTIDCLKNIIMKAKNMQYIHYEIKKHISQPVRFVCAFSSDSKRIVWCDENNIILCNNIGNPSTITSQSFGNNIGLITAVAFSPDGKNIVFGGHNFLVLYKISDLTTVVSKSSEEAYVGSLIFSPDGKYIFSSGINLVVWDASSLNRVVIKSPNKQGEPIDIINSLAISPDGKHIVSGGKRLLLWNINDDPKNMTYQVLMRGNDYIDSLVFSPDGKYIAWSNKKNLLLWDIDNLKKKEDVLYERADKEDIYLLGFSPDSKKIICFCNHSKFNVVSWKTKFLLYDISDLNKIISPQTFMEQPSVKVAAYSSDGNKIVFASDYHLSIILSILFTDEEISLINSLKNYNVDQLQLVYELCLWSLKGQAIPSNRCNEIKETFEILPEDMRELLYKLKLFNKEQSSFKRWFSGCTLF